MDFFHNPYRCGPLRVGRYALHPHLIFFIFFLIFIIFLGTDIFGNL